MPPFFNLALRNLTRNTKRTAVAVLTVACGLIALLLASGFIEWIFLDMRETTIRSQLGHIQIVRPDYYERGIADPYAFLLPQNSKEFEQIKNTPGVTNLAQRLAFSGLASFGDLTAPFLGEGIDPEQEQKITQRIMIKEGRNLSSINENGVMLGEGLAANLGISVGDKVVLLTTTAKGSANALETEVVGIFLTMYKDFNDTALRLPIPLARKLMKVEGATSWVILLDDTDKTTQHVESLRSTLDAKKYQVIPWSDLADFYNKTVVLFSKQVDVIKLNIALNIVLTISNIQTIDL